MQACEKIARGFLVARGDGPKMVDCIEEPLDEVALGIERAKSQSRLTLRFDLGGMTGLMARTFRLSTELSGHNPCRRGGLCPMTVANRASTRSLSALARQHRHMLKSL